MTLQKYFAIFVILVAYLLSPVVHAQEAPKGVFGYLQREPMTLFDAGMKSLRRLALESAEKLTSNPNLEATSSVNYKPTVGEIEIVINVKADNIEDANYMRQKCIDIRKQAIMKMFRIGLSNVTSSLSVDERIRRRIGGQFAHEPSGSTKETMALGDRLGAITYFSVNLSTTVEPTVSVTCRALATNSMAK